jgi:uncharacterized protein YoaH (UPF0181 family)
MARPSRQEIIMQATKVHSLTIRLEPAQHHKLQELMATTGMSSSEVFRTLLDDMRLKHPGPGLTRAQRLHAEALVEEKITS